MVGVLRRFGAALAAALLVAGFLGVATAAQASGSGVISGVAFQDMNRNGVLDAGEATMAGQWIQLFDATGANVGSVNTDANGFYQFSGYADGTYTVAYGPTAWWNIWNNWVPTTTGSLQPSITVSLVGSATANFGWRPIVRSTDQAAPITSVTGPQGIAVASYDDVISAQAIYDDLMGGHLFGSEAPLTSVRFDLSQTAFETVNVQGRSGSYSGYQATVNVPYVSWLQGGDHTLFHEYGHAWSLYYAYVVQQDVGFGAYLSFRGLTGNPNLFTSHAWSPREMIAEDYRQLFGTPNAQSGQENTQIPLAAQVPGLATFLSTTYLQAPTGPAVSTATPSVPSGTLQVGQTLSAPDLGEWMGAMPRTYTFQWQRCDSTGAACTPIAGAGGTAGSTGLVTYALASADAGSTIRFGVVVSNAKGSASSVSSPTAAVAGSAGSGQTAAPAVTVAPTISGTVEAGQLLTAGTGSWANSPTGYAFLWERCNSAGTSCGAIAGATAGTYVPTGADLGATLVVQVTASNAAGATSALSAPTAAVAAAPPGSTAPPAISGTAASGNVIQTTTGTWSGTAPFSFGYQWSRCNRYGLQCVPVAGATAASYAVTRGDTGYSLRAAVAASNSAGSLVATSAATGVVKH